MDVIAAARKRDVERRRREARGEGLGRWATGALEREGLQRVSDHRAIASAYLRVALLDSAQLSAGPRQTTTYLGFGMRTPGCVVGALTFCGPAAAANERVDCTTFLVAAPTLSSIGLSVLSSQICSGVSLRPIRLSASVVARRGRAKARKCQNRAHLQVGLAEEDHLALDLVDDEVLDLEPSLLVAGVGRARVHVRLPDRLLVRRAGHRLVRDVGDEVVQRRHGR